MRKLTSYGLLMVLLLSTSLYFAAIATAPTVKQAVSFVYEKEEGAYALLGTGTGEGDQYNVWSYDGVHWYDGPRTSGIPATGIKYYVNTKSLTVVDAVKAAFETWDAQVSIELFDNNVEQISKGAGNKLDGKNIVSWGALRRGIVAQCTIWYYTDTLEIVEIGIVFNKLYAWGIDPDGEGGATINAFDIQTIATHESGHTLSLGDLYMDEASELTMYSYASLGETKKRSLGLGDINGAQYIYGAA